MSVIIAPTRRTQLIAILNPEGLSEIEFFQPNLEDLMLGYHSLIPCNPGQEDWSFHCVSNNLCLIPTSVSPNLLDILY